MDGRGASRQVQYCGKLAFCLDPCKIKRKNKLIEKYFYKLGENVTKQIVAKNTLFLYICRTVLATQSLVKQNKKIS